MKNPNIDYITEYKNKSEPWLQTQQIVTGIKINEVEINCEDTNNMFFDDSNNRLELRLPRNRGPNKNIFIERINDLEYKKIPLNELGEYIKSCSDTRIIIDFERIEC